MRLRPHDLIRLADGASPAFDAPGWVRTTLRETPWMVVRRANAPVGFVAVGVRGTERSQRHALTIPHGAIGDVVEPEELAALDSIRDVAALRALAMVRPHLDDCAMPWGPTGSVGFELATGSPTVTPDSDLDLLVRAPILNEVVLQRLLDLSGRLRHGPVRVDCQVETTSGAVALAELTSIGSEVLLKTSSGPDLVRLAELLA
ncbi:MAG: malonate decarboxylase holo-ACP synthase [Mycobacterium sp.]